MSKSRREFIKHGAITALSAGPLASAAASMIGRGAVGASTQVGVAPPTSGGANRKLAVACVGVGGMGGSDLGQRERLLTGC